MPRVISLRTILTFPVASFDLSRTKGDSRTRTTVDGITRVTLSGNGSIYRKAEIRRVLSRVLGTIQGSFCRVAFCLHNIVWRPLRPCDRTTAAQVDMWNLISEVLQ